ncbi:hypothetical protein [Hymenobacter yonginensis]|uniref:Uncharacterized protein n=1 Tax=Hymenobacter yonginensis TaxID=748197 RepID=A0ABY7PJX6_9BACT|nr:hypothetical protein [Hymenobacter yonginensis]WBO83583.1 hypothetical protein O9Z63_14485 [Hymenobacter yonginensis]
MPAWMPQASFQQQDKCFACICFAKPKVRVHVDGGPACNRGVMQLTQQPVRVRPKTIPQLASKASRGMESKNEY